MTAPSVHIVCRNWQEERILPRMARYLADRWGWTLGATFEKGREAAAVWCAAYFEVKGLAPGVGPVGAYFTHREEDAAGPAKAELFDAMAQRVELRVVTARMYGEMVERYGPTVQVHAPVERERFALTPGPSSEHRKEGRRAVVGLAGYVYANHRKGEDVVRGVLRAKVSREVEWRGSGRGWPVPTREYSWEEMPQFYQGLDILVCPSRVEGIPMPPLEALACGVSVVIPRGVGMLDELPEMAGVYRYERGNVKGLREALGQAVEERPSVDRAALRRATEGHSVEAWCEDVKGAMEALVQARGESARQRHAPIVPRTGAAVVWENPRDQGTGSTRGIYCVAFGDPAREAARRMMESAKEQMTDIPICLCAAAPIGPEDLLIEQPDSDIGGRRAKLRAYELTPAEWQTVLYLDADIEIVAPVYPFFQWIEDGWELVICTDVPPNDLLNHLPAKATTAESEETKRVVGTGMALQFNGGVWAFRRNARVAAFFRRWREEWERWGAKDQGALLRAFYQEPLKTWVLGNEWNTFPKFQPDQATAGVLHYPGDARRWTGQIRGRIDSDEAWDAVRKFEGAR